MHLKNANGVPVKQGREIDGAHRANPACTLKRDAPKAIVTSAHEHSRFSRNAFDGRRHVRQRVQADHSPARAESKSRRSLGSTDFGTEARLRG